MKPTHFVGENGTVKSTLLTYGGEPMASLPVMYAENTYLSVWTPSEDELKTLNEGGAVTVACKGGQPEIAVGVTEADTLLGVQ